MLLKIEDLECRIGSTNILRSCSLELDKSQVVCLLGRNGAGKSSILKSIIGLYPAGNGKISYENQDITNLSPHQRVIAGIAYAPEDSKLFADLTVEQNIQLGFWVTSKTVRAASIDFETVFHFFPRIRSMVKRKADTLSGGEKKMVSISRALALSPKLVLLDEPFEGLSPVVVKTFSAAIENIKQELGISVLLAESNVHNASQVAEKCYIIERGQIIFEGPPSSILENEQILRLVGR
ncbi:MAG: ABC transporter ATP-binding protein [Deltaproteobacteria bacterium]|nr:ABC transporter ATP-binding protein [Deltaproteobacteria bacterium]